MEQPFGGAAFLIRLDPAQATVGLAGVATHVQSGERGRFGDLAELGRFLRNHADAGLLRSTLREEESTE